MSLFRSLILPMMEAHADGCGPDCPVRPQLAVINSPEHLNPGGPMCGQPVMGDRFGRTPACTRAVGHPEGEHHACMECIEHHASRKPVVPLARIAEVAEIIRPYAGDRGGWAAAKQVLDGTWLDEVRAEVRRQVHDEIKAAVPSKMFTGPEYEAAVIGLEQAATIALGAQA